MVDKLAVLGVKCKTCTNGYSFYKNLDEVLDDVEHGVVKFGVSYLKLIADIKKGGNFAEGAIYVADAVKRFGNYFPPTTVFEEVIEAGVRRVDVRVGNTFYEFKSVAELPPSGFTTQFIKDMDLSAVSSLDQIKWWFDAKKVASLPKQQFLDLLQNSTIDPLIIEKLVKTGPKTKQALIDLIDDNFFTIFLIK